MLRQIRQTIVYLFGFIFIFNSYTTWGKYILDRIGTALNDYLRKFSSKLKL